MAQPGARRRVKGEGSIFEQRPGLWRGVLELGMVNGKRVRKTYLGTTRKEVAQQLAAAVTDKSRGKGGIGSSSVTVEDYLESWLESIGKGKVREGTLQRYEEIVRKHLVPELGSIRLDRLTPARVQALMDAKSSEWDPHRKKVLAPRTVGRMRDVLRNALNQAVDLDLIPKNPAVRIRIPRVPFVETQVLTPAQAMELVATARTDPRGALYITALMVGMRQGELLALTWKDVDFDKRTLHIRQSIRRVKGGLEVSETKTSRSRRTVRMPELVAEVLLEHREAQLKEFEVGGMRLEDINELNLVFTNSLGRPIDASSALQKWFKDFLATAGLPPMRFHDLRHSCASLMLVQGVPARAVMATLGHSQIAVTMNTYAHVLPELQAEAAAAMDRALQHGQEERPIRRIK